MAPHSSTFAWKIPWTEEPGRLQSMGSLELDTTERLYFHFSLLCIGEGNGNPLQCSCLENPRDGGAWWAAVYGVAQSQTRLKRLSSSSSSSRDSCLIQLHAHWVCFASESVKVLVAQLCLTLRDHMDCCPPLSMEFSRQEYWSRLPFPSPGDLPDSRIKPGSPALQTDSLLSEPSGKPCLAYSSHLLFAELNCTFSIQKKGEKYYYYENKMWGCLAHGLRCT